ncbi:bacillithiol system redox-active protein YtxJ [Pseudalkalibacillus caeni]|uniref:Bacillithiol system redox-active protein YtxJ n=1 Tax=Exobacillus caeni TaxID=2574798 RepID=A0A5R9F5Q5_9BACL|nr:bacillithiol system redox-active protein YtxJ [Pseudalkalibacillus caeni]TLS39082.1 bacillithiol system redox-active protein YtxJ [Pseudalkalibacillus caeni]
MSLIKLENMNELENLLDTNKMFFFLKNSLTCPISSSAYEEFLKYEADHDGDFYYLNVQEAREFSNSIAEKYGIKHESPQVLLFKDNEVVWNDSHWGVTYSALSDAEKQYR